MGSIQTLFDFFTPRTLTDRLEFQKQLLALKIGEEVSPSLDFGVCKTFSFFSDYKGGTNNCKHSREKCLWK